MGVCACGRGSSAPAGAGRGFPLAPAPFGTISLRLHRVCACGRTKGLCARPLETFAILHVYITLYDWAGHSRGFALALWKPSQRFLVCSIICLWVACALLCPQAHTLPKRMNVYTENAKPKGTGATGKIPSLSHHRLHCRLPALFALHLRVAHCFAMVPTGHTLLSGALRCASLLVFFTQ